MTMAAGLPALDFDAQVVTQNISTTTETGLLVGVLARGPPYLGHPLAQRSHIGLSDLN